MKLFKHVEPMLMLAFFLLCAIGALQIGTPHQQAMTSTIVDNTDAELLGTRSGAAASMPAPMHMQTPLPMQMPVLTPMPMPMPVVHIIGRRMTDAEKRAAAASRG